MNKRNISLLVLMIVSIASTTPGLADNHKHAHHATSAAPAVCTKPGTLPSLRCAHAPNAVFDNTGRLWLAWASGAHVYVNYSDDKGKNFSNPVAVNRVPEIIAARGENRPKIAISRQGYVYVSWTQRLKKRFSGHIRFSRSIDHGEHFSDPITVNDHRAVTSHRFEALGISKRGDIYLAWLDKRDLLAAKKAGRKYNGAALYYALSTDGGKTFKPNKKVADSTCQCCRVVMAIDADGLPVIGWRHIFGKNTRDHALVKFTGRNQAGKPIRVSHDNWQVDGCPHHGPAISIANDGIYHLAWFNNAPERHGLFYAHSRDSGQTFSTPINFGNYKKNAAHPQVFSKGKHIFLAWKEFNGKQSELYIKRTSDGGRQWSSPRLLATSHSDTDYPLLIADQQTIYAVWHRRGEEYQLIPVSTLGDDL